MSLSKETIAEMWRIVEGVPKEDLAEFEQIVYEMYRRLNKRGLGKEQLRRIPGIVRSPEDCQLSGKKAEFIVMDDLPATKDMPTANAIIADLMHDDSDDLNNICEGARYESYKDIGVKLWDYLQTKAGSQKQ